MLNRLLSNIWVVGAVAALAIAVSVTASVALNNWGWLQRSGSIVTICGVILGIRPVLRVGLREYITQEIIIDGGSFNPTPEEQEQERQSKLDLVASEIGVLMAIIGTVVWGYGDLLGKL